MTGVQTCALPISSAALLEVLDPQQNNSFSDHYVNLPYDLSNVLFVATANHSDPIPSALFDRMEVINIPGYTEEEKLEIATRYLVPRQLKDNGLKSRHIVFEQEALKEIIAKYTRESGLRNLEREIGNVCRKVARKIAEGHKRQIKITPASVATFLGAAKYLRDDEMEKNEVGVVNGLAWTSVGGEVLHIEATTMAGKGGMALTGQLGDVMKESVQAALAYIRSHSAEFHIKPEWFQENEIHVHVPAGAVPKDGPSAGCAMATALVSVLTKVPVRKDVAMTGEISLRGKVLPIGGLKEKILAAVRAGMKTVIIPEQNKKDLEDIPKDMQKRVRIVPVREIDEVLKLALEKYPIPAPREKAKPASPKVVVRSSKELSA